MHQHAVKAFQFFCIHKHWNRIQRIGFFVCIVGQLGNVFLPDFLNHVGDAVLLFHAFNGVDEAFCRLLVRRIPVCQMGGHSQPVQLFVDAGAVSFQHKGQ